MNALTTWRKSRGLSQVALAERLGLQSRGQISDIETGAERVSAENAIKIDRLTAGEVTVADLRPDLADVRVLRPGQRVTSEHGGAA
jgi:DNA-binding transcriptional regulator YdaS (Cro superfamily)